VRPAELEALDDDVTDDDVAGDDFGPLLQPTTVAPVSASVTGTPTASLDNLLINVSFRPQLGHRKR